jgi:hypothetical protein
VSNKTLTTAVQTALDLCRDAYGNGISGQEERSLRYIALAVEQLTAVIQVMEAKSDALKSIELEGLTRSLRGGTHPAYEAFPEVEGSRASEGKWSGRNMPTDLVLRRVSNDALPPEVPASVKSTAEGSLFKLTLTEELASKLFAKPH